MKESRSKFIVCEKDNLGVCKEVANNINEWKVNVITVNRCDEEDMASLQQFLEEDDGTGIVQHIFFWRIRLQNIKVIVMHLFTSADKFLSVLFNL